MTTMFTPDHEWINIEDHEAAVVGITLHAQEALGDVVSDVRASQRLTESASCLVASAQGRDRELERLLARSQRGSGGRAEIARKRLEYRGYTQVTNLGGMAEAEAFMEKGATQP